MSSQQLDQLVGVEIRHNEATGEFTTNSIDNPVEKCTLGHQNDNEESKQMNSEQIENNEDASFHHFSKRILKYISTSDETSMDNAQNINSPDNLLLSPILNDSGNEVYFDKCASNKGPSEKLKIDSRSESCFPGVYKRESSTARFISEHKKDGSNVSSLVYGKFDEESQILIEERKCNPFNKDKNIFLESKEFAIKNARLILKNSSESSNSHFKSDFSPGSKESNEVSGDIRKGPISPEAAYKVRNRKEDMAFNMIETRDISENANVVAGPSGIRPYLLKQSGKKINCGVCHKEFARNWDFKNHYRIHTGEKPFVCDVCKTGFTLKENLRRHYITHTREKPFVCDVCKRGFTLNHNLKRHYRRHTD